MNVLFKKKYIYYYWRIRTGEGRCFACLLLRVSVVFQSSVDSHTWSHSKAQNVPRQPLGQELSRQSIFKLQKGSLFLSLSLCPPPHTVIHTKMTRTALHSWLPGKCANLFVLIRHRNRQHREISNICKTEEQNFKNRNSLSQWGQKGSLCGMPLISWLLHFGHCGRTACFLCFLLCLLQFSSLFDVPKYLPCRCIFTTVHLWLSASACGQVLLQVPDFTFDISDDPQKYIHFTKINKNVFKGVNIIY